MPRFTRYLLGTCLAGSLWIACSNPSMPFASYRQELFDVTAITATQEKVIRLANASADKAQHITAVAFDAGGNVGGNFQIKTVIVGGREIGTKDIVVPRGSDAEIHVIYTPKNLETTVADYGGWVTGQPTRIVPQAPTTDDAPVTTTPASTTAMKALVGIRFHPRRHVTGKTAPADANPPETIHRALMVLVYDQPQEGVMQIELVGRAIPGPNGEISVSGEAGGGGSTKPGECTVGGTTACFTGKFAIELPGLMKGGPVTTDLSGPMVLKLDGGVAQLDMKTFPAAVFAVKGNGPGEPLEGKPVSAIAIVISGVPDLTAAGSFDGSMLQLSDVGFRIRIYLREVTLEEADAETATADFLVTGLTLTTTAPLAGGKIQFQIQTTLAKAPSNNPLVDSFLSGAKVVVTMDGALQIP